MTKTTTAALAAITLSVALAGCTPTTQQAATATGPATPTVWTGSPAPSGPAAERAENAPAEGANLHQYIVDNKIAEVPFKADEPGTPKIDFAMPPDWKEAGDKTPEWAYGAIIYDKAPDPANPAFMYAIGSKLTGNVDPAKVLELAPGQLNQLPQFTPIHEPRRVKVAGFDAVNYTGTFVWEGQTRGVGQQTIVIPGKDAVFVLQLNGEAPDRDQAQAVIDAAKLIDEQTTITLPS